MYFGGIQTSLAGSGPLNRIALSPYDLFIAALASLLLYFFLLTAIKEMLKLAKENK